MIHKLMNQTELFQDCMMIHELFMSLFMNPLLHRLFLDHDIIFYF